MRQLNQVDRTHFGISDEANAVVQAEVGEQRVSSRACKISLPEYVVSQIPERVIVSAP